MCRWRMRTRAWWIDLASPNLNTCVCRRLSKKSSTFRPRTKSSFIRCSSKTPIRTRRLRRALPSNKRLGSFSSKVSSSRAALRILARAYFTRHTSRLFLKPYSPMSFNSWSRRAFSKGRRGVTNVLEQTTFILTDGDDVRKEGLDKCHFVLLCAWPFGWDLDKTRWKDN